MAEIIGPYYFDPWPLFLVRSLGVVPVELSDTNVALKWEAPEVGGTVANSQYNWNPIQLGWGAEQEFQECYPCVTHPGSSISTQPNERFMDLNYKGKPLNLNTFFNPKIPQNFFGGLRLFVLIFIKCSLSVPVKWLPPEVH